MNAIINCAVLANQVLCLFSSRDVGLKVFQYYKERYMMLIARWLLLVAHVMSGELAELKADLNDPKKEAVKKIIANMSVGKDVRSAKLIVNRLCVTIKV